MPLVKQYTLENLTNNALAMAEQDPEYKSVTQGLTRLNIHKCSPYDVPIQTSDVKTSIEIEYKSNDTTHGVVYIHGNLPYKNKMAIYSISTTSTDSKAYMAMWTICNKLAGNIEGLIRQHKSVTVYDHEITVQIYLKDGSPCDVAVEDILRRRNRGLKRTKTGAAIGTEKLNTADVIRALKLAKTLYWEILTPRKLERIDILIQEYTGARPGYKQRQALIREQKGATT